MKKWIYRIQDGQLWLWDDGPREEFGQIWIPVCVGCHGGPLDEGQVVCGECPAALASE